MKLIQLESMQGSKGHYAPGVVSGGMLYISGQLSIDRVTKDLPEGGIEAHTRQALSNLKEVLDAAGCTKEDVVMCRLYIADMAHWDAVNAVYGEFFGAHTPARVVVPAPNLHFGCLIEIEAMAECGEEK